MNELNDQYWSNRYKNKETKWDLDTISPPLKDYIDQLENKNLSILIPGCGNAYEAAFLLNKGFQNITLVDLSEYLIKNLEKKFETQVGEGRLKIIHENFFDLEGKFDLILEQTFFCALDPELRNNYAEKVNSLLKPNGKLVGLLFNTEFEIGPPFGGTKKEYEKIFEPIFKINTISEAYNSIEPRKGNELFINFSKINN